MRQILFVQGAGNDVHEQWDNKLVEDLRRPGGYLSGRLVVL